MKLFDMIEAKRREDRRKEALDNAAKVGTGLIAGLAIGSSIALLFAPQSGKETREDIKEYYDDKKKELKEGYDKAIEKLNAEKARLVENTRVAVNKVADKALNAAEDVVEAADEKVEEAKKATSKAKEKVEDKKEEVKKESK